MRFGDHDVRWALRSVVRMCSVSPSSRIRLESCRFQGGSVYFWWKVELLLAFHMLPPSL
mgnify:CR=1 FL=1